MDDKRDNIFDENEENIKNEEHIEETSKKTEDEMKETSDRESMKETQKLFNNENIDEKKQLMKILVEIMANILKSHTTILLNKKFMMNHIWKIQKQKIKNLNLM